MLIIGITGTIGAGKGTVVDFLIEKYHFQHYSVRKFLTQILSKQGLVANRDNLTTLANSLREKHNSPSYIIEELYKEAQLQGGNAVIESIRTVGEIDKLRSLGKFVLLAVDADQSLRYERIYARKSPTDKISFEKFCLDESREMHSANPNNQNLGACIQLADYRILNNGGLADLHSAIQKCMQEIV